MTAIVSQTRFYKIVVLVCITGWAWLILQLWLAGYDTQIQMCWVKNITGIPCPACGTTRSILCILNGKPGLAENYNIFGFPALFALTLLPIWLLADLRTKKSTLYAAYAGFEKHLKRKPLVFIFIIIIIMLNWAWNLYKHL